MIPTDRAGEGLRRCLASVYAATPPPDEVIVIVDGADESARALAASFGATVAETPERRGPAEARNVGARLASGDVLFFVDADVLIPPDAISQVISTFQSAPEFSALFGSYDDAPDAQNFLSQYKNLLHHYVHQTAREEASTFWSGCGAIRREAFLATGGYDVSYLVPSIEDIELGYRLRAAGYRIRLLKSLQVKHLKPWTLSSLLYADFFARALPWSELILRKGFINDLNVSVAGRASVGLTYALLFSLLFAWRWPALLAVSVTVALALLILNARLYAFFHRKRGLPFALAVIPWHWLYYLYSGLAFAVALIRRIWHSCLRPERSSPAGPVGGA